MSNSKNPKIFKPMTLKKSMQFLLLSLLWFLFSIPVVTCGAATCAVYYIAFKIVNDEDTINIFKLFLKGVKENFVQGLLMSIISAITLGGAGFLFWWIIHKTDHGILLILLALIVSLLILVLNIFTYPIIGRYENTFSNMLKNTVALAFTWNHQTFRLTCFVAAAIAIAGALFRLNILAGIVSLLFWPSVIFYIIASFMAWIFYQVENPKKYDVDGNVITEENNENKNEETES